MNNPKNLESANHDVIVIESPARAPQSTRSLLSIGLFAFTFLLAAGHPAPASTLEAKGFRMIEDSRIVSSEVLDSLRSSDQVGIRIFLGEETLGEAQDEVSPTIVDLVHLFLPGEIRLGEQGALIGTVDAGGLLAVSQNQAVLGVELDRATATADDSLGSFVCIPSSTAACLSGKFRVQVNGPFGPFARVGASSSQSAAFYFSNAANWEVVAKVLNGCGINNHYWVFAGKTTTQSYSISVLDVTTNQAKVYGPTCPVTDTTAFSCS